MNTWTMAKAMGYTPKTKFWEDFTIADVFGIHAIKDTFRRAFEEWRNNHIYLTELVLVLNHKMWAHQTRRHFDKAETYRRLWELTDIYAAKNLEGEELEYFLKTTD